MNHRSVSFGVGFKVVMGDKYSQAAQMTLPPGKSEGDEHNKHKGADQWLYVVSGSGKAIVGGKNIPLRAKTLVHIPRGTIHQIRNTGRTNLRTLNFYVPPAYTSVANELPRGRSS